MRAFVQFHSKYRRIHRQCCLIVISLFHQLRYWQSSRHLHWPRKEKWQYLATYRPSYQYLSMFYCDVDIARLDLIINPYNMQATLKLKYPTYSLSIETKYTLRNFNFSYAYEYCACISQISYNALFLTQPYSCRKLTQFLLFFLWLSPRQNVEDHSICCLAHMLFLSSSRSDALRLVNNIFL